MEVFYVLGASKNPPKSHGGGTMFDASVLRQTDRNTSRRRMKKMIQRESKPPSKG
jgi:hypothetical protein